MRVGITLVILGALMGPIQYIYTQLFSSLCLVTDYSSPIEVYSSTGIPGIVGYNYIRDWSVGIWGLVIGLILLSVGIYRLRVSRNDKEVHPE